MKVGDRVYIKTGKRGYPPRGVIVTLTPISAIVRLRGGREESYTLDALRLLPDGK